MGAGEGVLLSIKAQDSPAQLGKALFCPDLLGEVRLAQDLKTDPEVSGTFSCTETLPGSLLLLIIKAVNICVWQGPFCGLAGTTGHQVPPAHRHHHLVLQVRRLKLNEVATPREGRSDTSARPGAQHRGARRGHR